MASWWRLTPRGGAAVLSLSRGVRALSRYLVVASPVLQIVCYKFVRFFGWDEYKRPIHNTIKELLLCLHLSDLTADAFPNSPVPCCFGFNTRPTDIRNEGSLILYYSTTRLLRSKPMSLDLFEKKNREPKLVFCWVGRGAGRPTWYDGVRFLLHTTAAHNNNKHLGEGKKIGVATAPPRNGPQLSLPIRIRNNKNTAI